MKVFPLLAVGLLGATFFAGTLPTNAQTSKARAATVARVHNGEFTNDQTVFRGATTPSQMMPRTMQRMPEQGQVFRMMQERVIVTNVTRNAMTVRLHSGTIAQISVQPRFLSALHIRTGSRLLMSESSNGFVRFTPLPAQMCGGQHHSCGLPQH